MNTIIYEITDFHWFFQSSLIFFNEWIKKFFNNFLCFIINHDFYVITFWMYYMFFISIIFRRNIIFLLLLIEFSTCQISWDHLWYLLYFINIFFNWWCFSIAFTFIFNMTVTQKITCSYWFITISFFILKKIPNISNYSFFNCFIFFL